MPDVSFTAKAASELSTVVSDVSALKAAAETYLTQGHVSTIETMVNEKVSAAESRLNSLLSTLEAKVNAVISAQPPAQS